MPEDEQHSEIFCCGDEVCTDDDCEAIAFQSGMESCKRETIQIYFKSSMMIK